VLDREENLDIYFRLRCRKFIEMIRRSYEVNPAITSSSKGKSRYDAPSRNVTAGSESFDQQMELDDQLRRESHSHDNADNDNGTMDTGDDAHVSANTKSSAMMHSNLLTDAIQYGMELQAEFSGDARQEVKKALNDTFALIAYTDARDSELAEMMEGKGRVEIAEQVNGAILGMYFQRELFDREVGCVCA